MAWLALVVAVVGLGWSVADALIKRPRLFAELNKTAYVSAGGPVTDTPPRAKTEFHVIALNLGSEATTIWNAGLMRSDGTTTVSVLNARANNRSVEGPELPARIEPHGALIWTFADELTLDVHDEDELFGWISRYRPMRKLRMSKEAERERAYQWTSGKPLPRKFNSNPFVVSRSSRPSVRGTYLKPKS